MTSVILAPDPHPDAPPHAYVRPGERSLLDPAWPVALLTLWMPVAYFLGLSALVWILPAFAFGIPMLLRRSLRVPGMILPLAAIAVWIPLTALELPDLGSVPIFAYRWLLWVSAVVVMLWLCNTPTPKVPTKRIVDMLAFLWIVLVAFGYLAILMPAFEAPSLVQRFMPAGIVSNAFIYDLTVVRFAELQVFLTGTVPRPAAPMAYTNGWGSTMGLLLPFFIISWLNAPSQMRRTRGWIIAAAAVVPIAVSTNRGMWLSIAVALMYYSFRRLIKGDARPMFGIAVLGALAITAVLFTPLDGFVSARLSGAESSNSTREDVYQAAWSGTQDSPLLGHAAPVPTDEGPPIGTHGLVWYVMFSHGLPGLAMLIVALGALFACTAIARTPTALWAHIVILICITQIPYYGLLPQIVVIGFAAGICWRENHPEEAALEPR
jgi:O-antigen ligase